MRQLLVHDFAAVLLDVQMPGMSGFEVAKLIRGRKKSLHTPILFLTASAHDEFPLEEAYALGAVDYLVKPVPPFVLRAKLAVFVELFRRTHEAGATERRRAEEVQARLAAIVESSDDAIIGKDLDGTIRSWNTGAERIFGYTAAEAVNRSITIIVPVDRLDEERHILERLRRGERMDHFETVRVAKDGRRVDISLTVSPLRNSDGQLTGASKVARDVTDRTLAQQALRASEERYRVLATATSDVVYRMTADWVEMSPLDGRDLVASNAEPLRGWMEKNLPAHEHERVTAAIRAAVAGKSTFEMEHQMIRPDGTIGWTLSRAAPILDAAGNVIEWFGTARDVTERKRAEERLQRSHDTFLNLIQNNPFGVYLVDADFRLARVSLGSQKVFANIRPLLGRDFADVLRAIWQEPAASEFVGRFRNTLATGEPYVSVDTTAPRGDVDTVESYDWRIERVPLPDGRHGVVCYFYDMTERRRIEEALKDADRRKDEFLALLAHELRNPLAPLRNGLQVMRLTQEDVPAANKVREMMDRQLTHMVRLIDDLLDVSRISRNKMELRRTRLRLADVVASAVETVRPAVDAGGHELTVTLPDEPVDLDADLTRLAQVFGNLLSNSAKYTPPGGHIRLTAEAQGGEAVVTVADNGIGIPTASLPTIFDMFSQVDRSIERSTGGLGIGLALVKGLVEMHGGTVNVASGEDGRGSTFTVRLPLLRSHPATSLASQNGATPAVGPARRILVVDDNRDSAESLGELLRLLGNTVSVAFDGLQAVEMAERERPDVILMDVGMPRLNGFDATRRIREVEWGRDIVIVALTGWGQDGDRNRSKEAGCDGHLVKPVDSTDLESLLVRLTADRAWVRRP